MPDVLPNDRRFRVAGAAAFEGDLAPVVGLPDDRSFGERRLDTVVGHRRFVAYINQIHLNATLLFTLRAHHSACALLHNIHTNFINNPQMQFHYY